MKKIFMAGFARADVTPEKGGIPLAGYGATHLRLAARVLDPLYVHTVALRRGDETQIIQTFDFIHMPTALYRDIQKAVSEATGVPGECVFAGGTHTHSGPDVSGNAESIENYLKNEVVPKAARAACAAIADLKPAKIFYGAIETGSPGARLNFVRHYKMVPTAKKDNYTEEDIVFAGDNLNEEYFKSPDWYCVGHEEEADHALQVVRFVRDAADDIVMMNYGAHATLAGSNNKSDMSPDFPGAAVKRLEELLPDVKCTYLQGFCGNMNTTTRLPEEGILGLTRKKRLPRVYGSVIAAYAYETLTVPGMMKESGTSVLSHRRRTIVAPRDHSMDRLYNEAKDLQERYLKEGATPEVVAACKARGFSSPYHCNWVVVKKDRPKTGEIEICALRFGDVGMAAAPFEMFCGTGRRIKEKSPLPMTLVKGYSCGHQSYLPSLGSCPYSYEGVSTAYEFGTAEKLEKEFSEMLYELAEEK